MHSFEQASAYIAALTGEPVETAQIWFRCIHDTNKEVPAHKYYGTLRDHWNTLCDYNSRGYGIFCNINDFDANVTDHSLSNVRAIRVHVVDLDNPLTAAANYQLASAWQPSPQFAVNTSPGKHHVYWSVEPYTGNDYCTAIQRKLRQLFDGDKAIVDASRVLRVPGFYHLKAEPYMVTCHALAGYGQRLPVTALDAALAHVNVIEGAGGRHALGDPEMAAPSLDWLRFGLSLIDPNSLDRGEWISTSAAIKQAGWTLADEPTLRAIWEEWCSRYTGNDAGENDKQWKSIRDTEIGWNSIKRRAPTLIAYEKFGFDRQAPQPVPPQPQQPLPPSPSPDNGERDSLPDILSDHEQRIWFKNCHFVERMGKILTPSLRFMNSTQFNGAFGGKLFVITPDGKTTDEPWKAATRSTLWTIPKVDHVRFLPTNGTFTMVEDDMGRKGINTYIEPRIVRRQGDIQPFLRHMEILLPVEEDRRIIYEYMAHNAKYPGHKIAWAPMIQSAEGVGKGLLIKSAMAHALGNAYVYYPKAPELVKSGSTFNAWMRAKLMIIVDEIKIDERRELIEILKPMISDPIIEIQSKGIDQELEDNLANWWFFSNYKDAIPVDKNGRRYAIFYSAMQTKEDKIRAGLTNQYFAGLSHWLDNGGREIIADWLWNYPIERGAITQEAPDTSSMVEAKRISRGPIEIAIQNAIDDGTAGFRGGYVSSLAVLNRLRQTGNGGRQPHHRTIVTVLEGMGYYDIGRAVRSYGQENMNERTTVFAVMRELPVDAFGRLQGYE